MAAFNKTARQSSEGVRPHNPIGDRRPRVEISNGRVLTKRGSVNLPEFIYFWMTILLPVPKGVLGSTASLSPI